MIAIIFVLIINCLIIKALIKEGVDKEFHDKVFKYSIIAAIAIPVYFFAFFVPNIVIQGDKDIYSKVEYSSTGKIYDVMVTYDIDVEEVEAGEDKYRNIISMYPKAIHWSNGGTSYNSDGWYDTEGSWVYFLDQERKEYEVLIPEVEFNYKDQLESVGTITILVVTGAFVTSLFIAKKHYDYLNLTR